MRFVYGVLSAAIIVVLLSWMGDLGVPVSDEILLFSMLIAAFAGIALGK